MATEQKLEIDAHFTWERSLPVWCVQLLDANDYCVHRVERTDRTEAEDLAKKWAAKNGFTVKPQWFELAK